MKIRVIAAILLILLIFAAARFYHRLEAPVWAADDEAVMQAYQQTILAKATRVDTFVGERTYKIIYGTDALGQPIIVWWNPDDIHTEYAADGVSADALKAELKISMPAAHLLRIMPGKLQNDWVWELYYKKPDANGQQRYYYEYVKFSDGSLIDTYDLGTGKYF